MSHTTIPPVRIETVNQFRDSMDTCRQTVKQLADAPEIRAIQISDLKKQFGDELAGLLLHVSKEQRKAHQKLSPPIRDESSVTDVWWGTNRSIQQA
ncbi:MAG: hypothetical protein AAF664_25995, partial [Planctomycetota bacterium]